MSLLDELSTASYQGAEFLISSASTSGGRKDQRHEFPNSDKQSIEDFGLIPRVYSIVGWITGPDYIQKRDRLLAALENEESGVLSHPFYGEIDNIKARTFSIREDLTDLGRAEVNMTFEINDDIGIPEESENTLALLVSTNEAAQAAVNAAIVGNWEVNVGFSGNFEDAQSSLTDLSDSYEGSSNVIVKATDKINEFSAGISDFGSKINSLILEPKNLADAITSLGQTLNGLYSTSEQQLAVWKNLFGFGDSDGTATTGATAGLIQRQANKDVLNRGIQAQALCYAYLAASDANYANTDELDQASSLLEAQYQKLIANQTLKENLFNAIVDMREATNNYLNQRRITLNRIITIRTKQLPARVIAYQYYGDSSLGEEIASLNNDANVSFLEGDIEIVTQ